VHFGKIVIWQFDVCRTVIAPWQSGQ